MRAHLNASELLWNGKTFLNDTMSIVQTDDKTVAIRKGPILSVLTTVRASLALASCVRLSPGPKADAALAPDLPCSGERRP